MAKKKEVTEQPKVDETIEKLKIKNRMLKKYYASIVENPNLHKDYIYFAAPYQPEATSYIGGGYYENVILTIQNLSAACPQGWVIYYKEHPATFFDTFRGSLKRNKDFYRRLKSFKNVKFIPTEFDQFNLIDNSKAVAVIYGSTAWESVTRLVPVISFGQGWYSNCNGIIKVESMEDLLAALSKIYDGYRPAKEDVTAYIASILNNSFEYPEHRYKNQEYGTKRVNLVSDSYFKAYNKHYGIKK